MEYKQCVKCETEKHVSKFYPMKKTKDGLSSYCIACAKLTSKESKMRGAYSDPSERLVLDSLLNLGIPAVLGRDFGPTYYIDIIAWGCVRIEVKHCKTPPRENVYHWGIGSNNAIFQTDIIVLIDPENNCYVFPANHPVFFNSRNEYKTGITCNLSPSHYQTKSNPLTATMLKDHQDNWELIEQKRLEYVDYLRSHRVLKCITPNFPDWELQPKRPKQMRLA